MPVLQPDSLVLITGASGYIGTHTVQAALDAGFKVRIAVRSDAKAEHVKSLFTEADRERITHVLVPEISETNAYDKAVKGVDGVIHLASPVDLTNTGHPSLIIEPAVKGVTNLLTSLENNDPEARRVVLASSAAAISLGRPGAEVYTEKDWNDKAVEICETVGAAAPGGAKYSASKTLAERAFWKFIADHKPKWDGVAINPSFNMGPPLQYGEIASSVSFVLPWLKPGVPESQLSQSIGSMVDVRDVAYALVKALSTPEAAGERFILSTETLHGNDIALAVAVGQPEDSGLTKGIADPTFRAKIAANEPTFDGSKAAKTFGFIYRKRDATLAETAAHIRKQQANGVKSKV